MNHMDEPTASTNTFACKSCGANLKYKPGTNSMACDFCGAENEIAQSDDTVKELDFYEHLRKKDDSAEKLTCVFIKCESCGATSSIDPKIASDKCPYCGTPLIIANAHSEDIIKPQSLLPFKLNSKQAHQEFTAWVKKLRFAPSKLKKGMLNTENFKGIYVPYWTYDTQTTTQYVGQRGEYYYETETYTTTENGKTVTKTREVKKTRWYNVSGEVSRFFDDILVVATLSLPKQMIYALEPWDLENLIPFADSYLSGFVTEKYQIDLAEGFMVAQDIAEKKIEMDIFEDIGGDEQRLDSKHIQYDNITFKHLLLPAYICAYRYNGKVYRFMVNGRTGEVQGERPWSWIKILLLIIAIIAVIALISILL